MICYVVFLLTDICVAIGCISIKAKSIFISTDVHEFLQDIVLTFINFVESSAVKYNEAKTLFKHLSSINLDEDVARVLETMNTARNLSQAIGNISKKVRL